MTDTPHAVTRNRTASEQGEAAEVAPVSPEPVTVLVHNGRMLRNKYGSIMVGTPFERAEHSDPNIIDAYIIDARTYARLVAGEQHPTEENFQHFLAYTNYGTRSDLIPVLRHAFFHGANDPTPIEIVPPHDLPPQRDTVLALVERHWRKALYKAPEQAAECFVQLCEELRAALRAAPDAGASAPTAEKLAQFGLHPDPAIDFTEEVESIESLILDARAGVPNVDLSALGARIERALTFRVGGDPGCITAKAKLRRLHEVYANRAAPDAPGEANTLMDLASFVCPEHGLKTWRQVRWIEGAHRCDECGEACGAAAVDMTRSATGEGR